jgi:hypothetical protein
MSQAVCHLFGKGHQRSLKSSACRRPSRRRCPIFPLDAHIMSFGLTIGTERAIALQVRNHVLLQARY